MRPSFHPSHESASCPAPPDGRGLPASISGRRCAHERSALAHFERALDVLAKRPDEAVSLSMSVPFCAAHCLCCDRDVHTAQPMEVIADYVSGLVKEIHAVSDRAGGDRDVLQWHVGGGTANEFGTAQMARLVDAVQRRWRVPADAEMSLECDPRRTGWSQLQALRALGFRRVTFGVLDLDPIVQRAIGRRHSAALIDDVCELARRAGFECINLDLMFGLPHQSPDSWDTTLGRVLVMAPDRVTLARYRHGPHGVPAHSAIDATALPDAAQCQALAALGAARLCAAGYRWIGANQFVLESDELAGASARGRLRRSPIGYTVTPPTPVLGLGAGAISDIDGSAFGNEPQLSRWREAVGAGRLAVVDARIADAQELRRRAAALRLLCELELPLACACDGLQDAYARLARHAASGLVAVHEDRIVVTDAGRFALPALCGELGETAAPVDGVQGVPWLS